MLNFLFSSLIFILLVHTLGLVTHTETVRFCTEKTHKSCVIRAGSQEVLKLTDFILASSLMSRLL